MPFTIAQVSDSHLGTGGQRFRANFDRVVAALGAVRPDVVVASGDLSYDGVGTPGDLALAAAAFAGMPAPVHAIPGNHDVGDHPELSPDQPVTDLALRRFREVMGRDRWVIDRDDWRLIGLDSQIMGAHPEQDAQAAMVAEAVATLGGRRLAVFSHKPLFLIDPDDTSFDYWSVPPAARRAVMPILDHPALRLVASGHLHMLHLGAYRAARLAWCPSTAFVVAPRQQPGLPGARICAVLIHRFGEDGVETELLAPPGMDCPSTDEIADLAGSAAD